MNALFSFLASPSGKSLTLSSDPAQSHFLCGTLPTSPVQTSLHVVCYVMAVTALSCCGTSLLWGRITLKVLLWSYHQKKKTLLVFTEEKKVLTLTALSLVHSPVSWKRVTLGKLRQKSFYMELHRPNAVITSADKPSEPLLPPAIPW